MLGVAAVLASDILSAALRPVIELGSRGLLAAPLAVEHLTFASVQNVPVYELRAVVETPWAFTNHTVPVGSAVKVTVPRAHSLYHVVIVGAIVLAWPATGWRQRGIRLGLAIVAIALAVSLDAPVVLAAQAHALFFEQFAPARLDESASIAMARFLDHGGRLVVGALFGVLAASLSQRWQ